MLILRLKSFMEQRLEELARRTGRTKTFHAARAIEKCLPAFEKAYPGTDSPGRDPDKIREAIAILKHFRQGVTKPEGMAVREMMESGRA